MDRRKEARFQVYAAARLAPLQEPDRELDAQVVDISGLGLRLVTDIELPEDEIIVVETDQHLILAEVRNCMPRGSRFTIGAERIHSAAKLSVPPAESKTERNQALLDAYHQRLREELPTPPAAAPVAMPTVPRRPVIVPKSVPAPGAVQTETTAEAEAAPEPAPIALQPETVAETEPAPSTVQPEADAEAEPAPVAAEPEIADAAESPAEPPAMPAFTFAPKPLLSDPPPFDPVLLIPPKAPSRKKPILVGAICAVLALAILVLGPFSKRILHQPSVSAKTNAPAASAPVATPPPAAAAPAQPPAPTAAQPPAPADPAPAPTEKASAPAGMSHLSITASDRSWVTACSDGKVVYNKLFVSGDQESIEFSQRAIVRVGNAAPVEVDLNGKSIGSLGKPGQLRAVEITPDSWQFLHLKDPDGCTQ